MRNFRVYDKVLKRYLDGIFNLKDYVDSIINAKRRVNSLNYFDEQLFRVEWQSSEKDINGNFFFDGDKVSILIQGIPCEGFIILKGTEFFVEYRWMNIKKQDKLVNVYSITEVVK